MDEMEVRRLRSVALSNCEKLINGIANDREEIEHFFGGEIRKAYLTTTDEALTEARNVRTKIRNL